MHRRWKKLAARLAIVAVVVFALALTAPAIRAECDALAAAHDAAHHPPSIARATDRVLLDFKAPWVAQVVVKRSPLRWVNLDCAERGDEPPPFEQVPVDFTQTMVTGGTTLVTTPSAPAQYIGGGGAILPS